MMSWHALEMAGARAMAPRVPFFVGDNEVGSVAQAHLPALRAFADLLKVQADGVLLSVPEPDRDAAFAQLNAALRAQGLIKAWRDESYAVTSLASGVVLARIERASSRFWGTLTFGAHATGYVVDGAGRATHLWIAKRSPTKATDPGLFDNLIGGGVPFGQTPLQTLVREGWEEAGLTRAQMSAARAGRVVRLARDIPEGFQLELLHCFDLPLRSTEIPSNQDGEVAGFTLMPVAPALALAASESMTVDAALATLDFALRHGLLAPAVQAELAVSMAALWVKS